MIVLQPLQRRDLGAVGRDRERDAGPRRRAVDHDGACAADAVLAPDMRAGQELVLAQEIGEVQARLDLGLHPAPIDGERQRLHEAHACFAARLSATGARLRRYSSFTFFPSRSCSTASRSSRSARSDPNAPPKQRSRIRDHDRSGFDGADHGAKPAAGRIMQHAADRVGELAGLLAEFVKSPARARRELRHANRLDELVGLQHRGKRREHQIGDRDRSGCRAASRPRPARRPVPMRRSSPPPGRHARGSPRSCRDCAPRDRRCGRPPGEADPGHDRERGRPRCRHG